MKLRVKQILNQPVFTKSEVFLGKVCDLEFSDENYILTQLWIKKGLLDSPLIVSWSQIIKIAPDRIIVEDLIMPEAEAEIKAAF